MKLLFWAKPQFPEQGTSVPCPKSENCREFMEMCRNIFAWPHEWGGRSQALGLRDLGP